MSEEALKHWRYGGKISHIGVEALPNGENIDVTIKYIEYRVNEEINGKKQDAWVAVFEPNRFFQLPMILNATNRKRICRMAKNNYPETIKDFRITLTKEMDRTPEGIKDWCLRVSPTQPRLPDFTQEIESECTKLKQCKTLYELKTVYAALKHGSDIKVIAVKDELKGKLK